jgi:hypothetical protein
VLRRIPELKLVEALALRHTKQRVKNNFRNLKVAITLREMIADKNWEAIFDASLRRFRSQGHSQITYVGSGRTAP